MNHEEKETLKKELRKQINSVKKELSGLAERIRPVSYDKAHGRMGGIDAMREKSFQKRQADSLKSRLHELELNLANIESSAFGICECCGTSGP